MVKLIGKASFLLFSGAFPNVEFVNIYCGFVQFLHMKSCIFMGVHGTVVLILRIWALYNNSALLAGLCASSALSIVFFNVTNDKVIFLDNPTSGVFTDGCLVIHPSTMWMNYLSYVIFDAILFMLTAWRVWVSSREFGSTPLMQRLVENGALHSGVLAVLIVFACAGGTINTLSIPSTAGLIWGMSSVVCSRNIFSLHTLAEEERRQGLSESTSEWLSLGELRVVTPMTELNTTTSASLPSGGSSFRT
ncbi:hypothetical protein FRC08_006671 [Ceratobasidium sp. 394]|nr:hypothetical protein FRC08_006671 [Ceratobasidium sp. 394]